MYELDWAQWEKESETADWQKRLPSDEAAYVTATNQVMALLEQGEKKCLEGLMRLERRMAAKIVNRCGMQKDKVELFVNDWYLKDVMMRTLTTSTPDVKYFASDTTFESDLKDLSTKYASRGSPGTRSSHRVTGKLHVNYRHVLTEVLSETERDQGFNLHDDVSAKREKASLWLKFVSRPEFQQQLEGRRHWKDPMVPGNHGEFTHRIQWFIFMTETPAVVDSIKWPDYFAWIGRQAHVNPWGSDKLELTLWDFIFDRNAKDQADGNGPYNTKAADDFRAPENLHPYIMTQLKDKCPLLSGFIAGRHDKRSYQLAQGDYDSPDSDSNREDRTKDYAAKKMFAGKKYASLDPSDRLKIDAFVDSDPRKTTEGILYAPPKG